MQDFTERNAAIVTAVAGGLTPAAAGAEYGISRERVRQILVQAGIKPDNLYRKRRTFRQVNIISALYDGRSINDIAGEFGIGRERVLVIARKHGIIRPRTVNARTTELTSVVVNGINAGRVQREIAEELGISQSYVSAIAVKNGLRRQGPKPYAERNAAVVAARERGAATADIAAEFNISKARVLQILNAANGGS